MKQAHQIAAHIVCRAAFAKLDCGSGDLANHVGCAFDVWVADQRSPQPKMLVATDALRLEVYEALRDGLGFQW